MRKLMIVVLLICLRATLSSALPVVQSARDIPIVRECDVLVVGGGSVAVAAALSAKTNGCSSGNL